MKCKHEWEGISSAHSGIKGAYNHFYAFVDICKVCKIKRIKRDFTFGYWRRQKTTYSYIKAGENT